MFDCLIELMFRVYLCNLGRVTKPLFQGIEQFWPDKIILLNSRKEERDENGNVVCDYRQMESEVISMFNSIGIMDVEVLEVDVYDYHDVFTKVRDMAYSIQDDHEDSFFRINITLGTNVAASAISNLAYHVPSEMYYSVKADPSDGTRKDKPRIINVESLDEIAKLRRLERTVELLGLISSDTVTNEQLRSKMNIGKSTLSHHLSILQSMKLIEYSGTKRSQRWFRTEKGDTILKRLS